MLPVFHSVVAEPAGATYRKRRSVAAGDFEDLVAMLTTRAPLRSGLTRRRAVDILFVLAGPENDRSFVLEAGWRPSTWATWTTINLSRELVSDDA